MIKYCQLFKSLNEEEKMLKKTSEKSKSGLKSLG